MPKNVRFWRNVTLIGLAHVALIVGLVRWSRETKNANTPSVVWMNGGAGDGSVAEAKSPAPKPVKTTKPPPERTPEPLKKEESEEEHPVLTSVKSEIQLPTPKPTPTPTPKPTPLTKAAPKPTPKPTPKPAPKPKPSPKKTVLAKASPKPSPKIKPTPAESEESDEQADADAEKKKIAKAALAKNDTGDDEEKLVKKPAAQSGSGKGTAPGAGGGHAGGAGSESQFGWYGSMLHDRFYSEWVQPTTVASSGAKFSVLVKLRIEKDGHVSNFEIIKPSGNATVDESVSAVARRVTQVDPLPAGLGNGEHYDVKINFELNSEQ